MSNAEALKLEGNKCFRKGEYKDAIEYYTQAIQLDPKNAVYYCNRAGAYSGLNEYNKSITDALLAIQLNKNYNKAHGRIGYNQIKLKHYQSALQSFKNALELTDENDKSKINEYTNKIKYCITLMEEEKFDKIWNIKDILVVNQNRDIKRFQMFPNFVLSKQETLVEESVDKIAKNMGKGNIKKDALYFNLALTALKSKNLVASIRYFKIGCNNSEIKSLCNLGLNYLMGKDGVKKNLHMAFKLFKYACYIDPNCGLALYNVGTFYLHGHGSVTINEKIAVKLFKKAIKDDRMIHVLRHYQCYFELGNCYLLGKGIDKSIEKAKKYFNIAKTLNPQLKGLMNNFDSLMNNNNNQNESDKRWDSMCYYIDNQNKEFNFREFYDIFELFGFKILSVNKAFNDDDIISWNDFIDNISFKLNVEWSWDILDKKGIKQVRMCNYCSKAIFEFENISISKKSGNVFCSDKCLKKDT